MWTVCVGLNGGLAVDVDITKTFLRDCLKHPVDLGTQWRCDHRSVRVAQHDGKRGSSTQYLVHTRQARFRRSLEERLFQEMCLGRGDDVIFVLFRSNCVSGTWSTQCARASIRVT
jgi:hypothetical protein